MQRFIQRSSILMCGALMLWSCSLFTKTATVSFELTDAPLDSGAITAVTMTVSSVAVHTSSEAVAADAGWKTLTVSPARAINVLELQGGLVSALGDLELPGGTKITQIRLGVDKVEITRSGSVIQATIPGGTEFKLVGSFDVPTSGGVTITVDFDARKSIVVTGNNAYRVKPSLRAIVPDEAGAIAGTATAGRVVYAYADGTWAASETSADANGLSYASAYSSTVVGSAGSYKLAFLAPGTYDLREVDASTGALVRSLENVSVAAGATTQAGSF